MFEREPDNHAFLVARTTLCPSKQYSAALASESPPARKLRKCFESSFCIHFSRSQRYAAEHLRHSTYIDFFALGRSTSFRYSGRKHTASVGLQSQFKFVVTRCSSTTPHGHIPHKRHFAEHRKRRWFVLVSKFGY